MRERGKLWTSFGKEKDANVALDLSLARRGYGEDLNVEPPQLIIAPMEEPPQLMTAPVEEETITLYADAPPEFHLMPLLDTGRSKDATEKMTEEVKVRKSTRNREIVEEDANTVRVKEERAKVTQGQQQMQRLHLYNEDEEEKKQRKKIEEKRKSVESEMRHQQRLKMETEQHRTRRNSSSHQFPSSVRPEFLL